jgi:hypothetical protein
MNANHCWSVVLRRRFSLKALLGILSSDRRSCYAWEFVDQSQEIRHENTTATLDISTFLLQLNLTSKTTPRDT